jgi:hypothetical protein
MHTLILIDETFVHPGLSQLAATITLQCEASGYETALIRGTDEKIPLDADIVVVDQCKPDRFTDIVKPYCLDDISKSTDYDVYHISTFHKEGMDAAKEWAKQQFTPHEATENLVEFCVEEDMKCFHANKKYLKLRKKFGWTCLYANIEDDYEAQFEQIKPLLGLELEDHTFTLEQVNKCREKLFRTLLWKIEFDSNNSVLQESKKIAEHYENMSIFNRTCTLRFTHPNDDIEFEPEILLQKLHGDEVDVRVSQIRNSTEIIAAKIEYASYLKVLSNVTPYYTVVSNGVSPLSGESVVQKKDVVHVEDIDTDTPDDAIICKPFETVIKGTIIRQ